MGPALDLTGIRVVDNHCHGLEEDQRPASVGAWRSHFTESPHQSMRTRDAADTAFYRRLLHAMTEFYGVADDDQSEQATLAARGRSTTGEIAAALFADAGVAGLVVDTGFPPADTTFAKAALTEATGVQQVDLLRLEPLFQDLVVRHHSLRSVEEALLDELDDVRGSGFSGFKSVVGYRTGLGVERWPRAAAESSFAEAREEASASGGVRLGHKPLLDTLLHVGLGAAAEQELPVQFHVGYGDPDADLRTAAPLELRAVLEDPAYRPVPIVLLHSCWPYFREGAYLAAVYQNVYLDLSYGIPFLSIGEMTSMTRAALGAAPFSKLMYSSDGVRVPELHWLAAHAGRRILGTVLGELVGDRELSGREADDIAQRVLRDNAWHIYGFSGMPQ